MRGARRGFTLVELVIALLFAGLVAAAAIKALLFHQRMYQEQMHRADNDATLRAAALILRSELRGLNSRDSLNSDIVRMLPSSMIYKVTRSLRFLCQPPDTQALAVTTWDSLFGVRELNPEIDSVLLLAIGDGGPTWVHGGPAGLRPGACPDGSPGVVMQLDGVPREVLATVFDGAPVLGLETSEVRSYRDASGEWWVGMRRYQKARRRWPVTQPLVGPFAPGGLDIKYLDRNGSPTGDPSAVVRIRIGLAVERPNPFRRGGAGRYRFIDVDVALRGRGAG